MGIISQFMKNNGVTLATLLSWQNLTVPCTKPATLPNAFLGNNCQGIYRTGETTQLTAGAFGFLSDPDSLRLYGLRERQRYLEISQWHVDQTDGLGAQRTPIMIRADQ